jgi:methionyl-tRNA formyltransferase
MGTPEFAARALQALIDGPHEVIAAYSQPPRPSGRGMKLTASPIQQLAEKNNIPVFTPTSLKKSDAQEQFKNLNADVAVVAAYGLILPQIILDAPKFGCVNIHASILPRWRGAAPIHRAILAGDAETGITFMQMDAGLDTGAMLRVCKTPITNTTTVTALHDTLADIGAQEINSIITDLAAGKITPTPQPVDGVTYADKLKKEESIVDWAQPAAHIDRRVRALNPWPGVWAELFGKRVKILRTSLAPTENAIEQNCSDGKIYLTELQPDGGKPMAAKAFMQGQ